MSDEVLLVEADPSLAELIHQAFHDTVPDAHVQLVESNSEALDFLFHIGSFSQYELTSFPAFILLDLNKPQASRLSLLEIIKAYARIRFIPIIIMVAPNEMYAVSDSYRRGASACILKSANRTQFAQDIADTAHYWLKVNRTAHAEERPASTTDAAAQV